MAASPYTTLQVAGKSGQPYRRDRKDVSQRRINKGIIQHTAHQQAATALCHKILQQRQLLRTEKVRINVTYHHRLILIEVFCSGREPVVQLQRCIDTLSVEPARPGLQIGGQTQAFVTFGSPPDELELITWMALNIKNIQWRALAVVDQKLIAVILGNQLSIKSFNFKFVENRLPALRFQFQLVAAAATISAECHISSKHFSLTIENPQLNLTPFITLLLQRNLNIKNTVVQYRAGCCNIGNGDILLNFRLTHTDGKNWHLTCREFARLRQHIGTGIVGTIADQHNATQRQPAQLVAQLLQCLAGIRQIAACLQFFCRIQPVQGIVERECPQLISLGQRRQYAVVSKQRPLHGFGS